MDLAVLQPPAPTATRSSARRRLIAPPPVGEGHSGISDMADAVSALRRPLAPAH
jgi:hypothetical protein